MAFGVLLQPCYGSAQILADVVLFADYRNDRLHLNDSIQLDSALRVTASHSPKYIKAMRADIVVFPTTKSAERMTLLFELGLNLKENLLGLGLKPRKVRMKVMEYSVFLANGYDGGDVCVLLTIER